MTKYLLTKPGGPWDFPALGFSAVNGAILDGDLPVIGTFTSPPGPEWSVTTGVESGVTRYAPPSATVTYLPIPVPGGLIDAVSASLVSSFVGVSDPAGNPISGQRVRFVLDANGWFTDLIVEEI